jgi:hypothetical protein
MIANKDRIFLENGRRKIFEGIRLSTIPLHCDIKAANNDP